MTEPNQARELLATISGELAWLKWMVGTNIVLTLGVLWRLLK